LDINTTKDTMMRLSWSTEPINNVEAGIVIIGTFAEEPLPAVAAGLLEEDDWKGAFKKTLLLYPRANTAPLEASARAGVQAQAATVAAPRLLLVGLGKRAELTTERVRQAMAVAAKDANEIATDHAVVQIPDGDGMTQATAEALLLGTYRFDQFKGTASKGDTKQRIERATLVGGGEGAADAIAFAEHLCAGVMLARDLGNEPPATCTPTRLAEVAQEIATRGKFKLTVLDTPEMEKLGMGGMLGVARGSTEPPKFIVLEYGTKGTGKTLALVGKGITFDTGGISIKPAERMDAMKMDMMGAGAVLGAMSVLADVQPPNVHVVGIVCASENKPSGSAFVPGDILKALNGVTIEIINTDAEGRLVLADGLSYVQRYEPDAIVDLATLTGAMVVALGEHVTGFVSNNADFAAQVKAAGDRTGELVWELPLLPEYRAAVKSTVADIRNTAGRPAGAIKAGAFLEHFVDDKPWVHLDIAGTSSAGEQPKPYAREGASGVGVRLLVDLVQNFK
jgi:leucyl aminopeptidase